jgi:hypothetical protein
MNIYQRIILILGAIALAVAIWTTPKVIYYQRLGYVSYNEKIHYPKYPQRHFGTVVVRSIGVIGVTALIFFAFKRRKKGGDRGGKDLQER